MKFTTVLVSALAAVVSAAPAKKESPRGVLDVAAFNNFGFNSVNLQYLGVINSLDFNVLQSLASVNNFDLNGFQNLFSGNSFNVQALLQLQQLQMVIQLQQLGILGGFDLSSLALNSVNLGLINTVGSVDLTQFIDASLAPQIQTIIQQSGM
jgi:hypothetical protein